MIIGAILEVSDQGSGAPGGVHNGNSMLHFYTMSDAVTWARLQSESMPYGSSAYNLYALTTIVNTDTGEKRWWYNGVEYTG